ncbi:MAG: diguanylate cyclase domain-containing protein [Lachnospiraceae bacterium]
METKTIKANELYDQARRYLAENKFKDAIMTFQETLIRAEEIGEHWLYARAMNGMGVTYAAIGNDMMALDCYLDGLEYIKKHEVIGVSQSFYNNIGMRYYDLGAYKEALEYFHLAEESMGKSAEPADDRALFAVIVYLNLSDCYRFLQNYQQAEIYLTKAMNDSAKFRVSMFDFSMQVAYARLQQEMGNTQYVEEHINELVEAMDRDQENMGDFSSTIRGFVELLIKAEAYDAMKIVIGKYEKQVNEQEDNKKRRLQVIEHYIQYYHYSGDEENFKNSCVEYAKCMAECEEQLNQEKLMTLNLKVALKKAEDDLKCAREKSEIDALTGLKNRYAMESELPKAIEQCSEKKQNLIVGILDIDCFKQYNDTYGHLKGDAILQRVGAVLRTAVGNAGNVYRLGGDEFLVMLEQTSREKGELVAANIDQLIRKEEVENRNSFVTDHLTISQGYYMAVPKKEQCYTDYIDCADKALYQVKRNGRNSFLFRKK